MARIYVVDDDTDVRHVISYALDDEGHEVTAHKDGEAALEALLAAPPDLMILDLMMPGYDGYEILEQMDGWGLREATRVLVLTAKVSAADRSRALSLGADAFMTKPFDPDALADRVRELLALSNEDRRAQRVGNAARAFDRDDLAKLFGGEQ